MISSNAVGAFVAIAVVGPVAYMALDRDPCDGFYVEPVKGVVEPGTSLIAVLHYGECRIKINEMLWHFYDGKGNETGNDGRKSLIIQSEDAERPTGLIVPIPLDAFPGRGSLRLEIHATKNPLQQALSWPVTFSPPDVTFTIESPPTEAQEPKTNG